MGNGGGGGRNGQVHKLIHCLCAMGKKFGNLEISIMFGLGGKG